MSKFKKFSTKYRPVILITGGSGYIGIHLIHVLSRLKKFDIIVLDKKPHSYLKKLNISFIKLDLTKKKKVNMIFQKLQPFLVIHLSGLAHIAESFKRKKLYRDNNEVASLNLLNAMKKNNCKNIIFASSCLVYSNKSNQK